MKDNAVVIEYIKLPCQRGGIYVEFVPGFCKCKPWCTCCKELENQVWYTQDFIRYKCGHTSVFQYCSCFYFLVVLAPPVSDMTLRGDLGHRLGWPNMPMCFSTYKKPNSWKREQLQAMSTPGFGAGPQRVTVIVMLSKVTCRFSSKGFDVLHYKQLRNDALKCPSPGGEWCFYSTVPTPPQCPGQPEVLAKIFIFLYFTIIFSKRKLFGWC